MSDPPTVQTEPPSSPGVPFDAAEVAATALLWSKRVVALADYGLRATRALGLVTGVPTEYAAAVLNEICHLTEDGNLGGMLFLLSLVPAVVDPERLPTFTPFRKVAHVGELSSLRRWLSATTTVGHRLDAISPADQSAIAQHSDGRPLALGERRALARQPNRRKLEKLLVDPNPMVVKLLLTNSRLTEDDVVRMAARQPARRENSVEIAKAWPRSTRVRFALISNPYTPEAVSVPLLALLNRAELREVRRATNLSATVRTIAGEMATLRPPMKRAERGDDPTH